MDLRKLLYNYSKKDEDVVIQWFKRKGWQTKKAKGIYKFISRKGKHHTKIQWHVGSGPKYVGAILFKKTPNNGWSIVATDEDLQVLIDLSKEIKAPILITKETLPKPLTLDMPTFCYNKNGVRNYSSFSFLQVKGVVGLEKDGTISVEEIYNPKETPWIHFKAFDYQSSFCEFISDGEVLHPLNVRFLKRKTKVNGGTTITEIKAAKVTSNVPIMLTALSVADKKMISMAIENFFNGKK